MSIQQDILDTIGATGIGVKVLRERLSNIGGNELDIAINALQRAKRVRVVNECYEVIPSTRPLGGMPHTGRPPSAEEEAAASLLPVTRVCITCRGEPQPLHQFRFIGPGNERARECNACHGKRTQAGNPKKRGQRATTSSEGAKINTPVNATAAGQNPEVIVFHSACREDAPVNGSGAEHSTASSQPVIADRVFERVKAQRQAALNRIAILEVELANERSKFSECEQFLRLYERFSQGAG